MSLLIKNLEVVDKSSAYFGKVVNLLIKEKHISEISESPILNTGIAEFDAHGLKASTGWVDIGTHYKDPGLEWLDDLFSISDAAAHGGFTHVVGMPNTIPVVQTKEGISYFQNHNKNSCVELLNLAAVTKNCKGEDFTDMIDLKNNGAIGFSDGEKIINNTDIFLKTLLYIHPLNSVLVVKSDDHYLSMFGQMHEGEVSTRLGLKGIPAAAEELMVFRNLKLLEYSGIKSDKSVLHFSTLSTAGAIDLIRQAKKRNLPVSCDIAAHHLVFSDEDLENFDTHFKVMPPFRSTVDIQALIAGLKDGTIDAVCSDHSSWDEEHKSLEFDAAEFGSIGLQTAFPALIGNLGIADLVKKLSTTPRKIFGLPANEIKEGSFADLCIFDDKEEYIFEEALIKSKGKNSPFLKRKLKGRVKAIYNNGIFKNFGV